MYIVNSTTITLYQANEVLNELRPLPFEIFLKMNGFRALKP